MLLLAIGGATQDGIASPFHKVAMREGRKSRFLLGSPDIRASQRIRGAMQSAASVFAQCRGKRRRMAEVLATRRVRSSTSDRRYRVEPGGHRSSDGASATVGSAVAGCQPFAMNVAVLGHDDGAEVDTLGALATVSTAIFGGRLVLQPNILEQIVQPFDSRSCSRHIGSTSANPWQV